MDEEQYLDDFAARLQEEFNRICRSAEMMGGQFLENDDIDFKFEKLAPGYFGDAVKEIPKYPEVSIAWAGYLGMGVAKLWDFDYQAFTAVEYKDFLGLRGFDDLDEHILISVLGYSLDSDEAARINGLMSSLAAAALTLIRHENVEPQSPRAYYVYARAVQAIFRTAASVELHLLGYKFERYDNCLN